jgi:hypothetical protein
MLTKEKILQQLPPFKNKDVLLEDNQTVHDIISEVCTAHKIFASNYDTIAKDFDRTTLREIGAALFSFCKRNIKYKVEPQRLQTTKSPAAIIALGDSIGGDCKHYAGFIAGVLDALKRRGKKIDWEYRFASYNTFDKLPQHVFVVARENGREIWIDPVLDNLDQRLQPAHSPINKKVSSMALHRISGLSDIYPVDFTAVDDADLALDPDLLSAIQILLEYKVLDFQGNISQDVLNSLPGRLAPEKLDLVIDAFNKIREKAIGGFFADIWSAVKTVSLAVPRTAYLQLILINFNGWATKMYNIIYDEHNVMRPEAQELKSKWESLGGSWQNLVVNVVGGKALQAVIGAVQAAAWAATAAVIIVAMTPIITNLVNKLASKSPALPTTSNLPAGTPPAATGSNILTWIKNNPAIVAAGAAAGYYLYTESTKKKRRTV